MLVLFLSSFGVYGQTLNWDWANSAGGNGQDVAAGDNSNTYYGSMHMDTSGNVYELILSPSSTITFGSYTFTNPGGGTGASSAYLVKYNRQGTVIWAQKTGSYIPISMYTDERGYSYMAFTFRDSLRLGSMFLVDTSIHITASTNNGYCIAEYDPNGNVVSLSAHPSPHSSWIAIRQFNGHEILAAGYSNMADTLNGHPLAQGYFISILDSLGNVLRIKSIGYDSTGGAFISATSIASGGRSIYVTLTYITTPYIYPSAIPIANVRACIGKHLLVKFDSLLHCEWYKVCSPGVINNAPIYADQQDNVYLDAGGSATVPQDTLSIDTNLIVLPFIAPLGQYSYVGMAKIDSSGALRWVDKFVSRGAASAFGLCTDRLGDVYLLGTYNSYLIFGSDTLNGYGNIFVCEVSKSGLLIRAQNTQNGQGHLQPSGIAEDGHGNVFINGIFSTSNHPFFGADSLVCHTPVSGQPLATDVFTARLGNCNMVRPVVTASSPLSWCGRDSVILTASVSQTYLWTNGDTSRSIVADSSGLYSVYAIDSMGCYAQSAVVSIAAHPQPSLTAAVIKEVSCFGNNDGHISLSAAGGIAPYAYNSLPQVANYQAVAAGTYTISLTDSNGCTARDTVRVTQPANALQIQIDTIHDGAIVLASGATAPYSYLWSDSLRQDTVSHLQPGWYSVTVTDSNGCRATDSVYIKGPNGINTIGSGRSIRIYPNPGTDVCYVETDAPGYLSIYDMNGREVVHMLINEGINRIDVNAMTEGIYQMEISNGGGARYEEKLTVVH